MCPTTFLKSDRIKNILFSFIFVLFGVEKLREGKEMSLNKFTHKPLLKNDVQLKQKKVTNNHKKKKKRKKKEGTPKPRKSKGKKKE